MATCTTAGASLKGNEQYCECVIDAITGPGGLTVEEFLTLDEELRDELTGPPSRHDAEPSRLRLRYETIVAECPRSSGESGMPPIVW